MNENPRQCWDLTPSNSPAPPLPAHEARHGARPQGFAMKQNLENRIACQPVRCRVALPFPIAAPLLQSLPVQPHPESMPPVLECGHGDSVEAGGVANPAPAFPLLNPQPVGAKQQNSPLRINAERIYKRV